MTAEANCGTTMTTVAAITKQTIKTAKIMATGRLDPLDIYFWHLDTGISRSKSSIGSKQRQSFHLELRGRRLTKS